MRTRYLFPLLIFGCIVFACNAQPEHKTAEQIYSSGIVDNIEDFKLIAHYDSFLEVFQYKYDTNLILFKVYTVSILEDKRTFRNYEFHYKGKLQGKVIFFDEYGKRLGEAYYEDGKEVRE